ncbi:hypothetical protein J5X84_32840 [Streptosporangiaceae bacterium NEAU-GS5]|nr:hypothetical protein [Streptosporangiaceae bacterium NEAU-GS5]
MFSLKKALTATALTSTLAGGFLAIGTVAGGVTSANASATGFGPQWWGPRCVWMQHNNQVRFGHKKNKVTVTKFRHSPFFVRKEIGCVRNLHKVW